MIDFTRKERYDLHDLQTIVTLLRSPEGCPWDQAQTHLSIRRNLLEEAYEACEALEKDDVAMMTEELGDVLLQVLFHADLERESGRYTLDDICDAECKKLIYRHPHVFGGEVRSWEEMKQLEKGQKTLADTLDAVARTMPGTWRAAKLHTKTWKVRQQQPTAELLDELRSAVDALSAAVASGQGADEALGGVLFAACGVGAALQTDEEQALHSACETYIDAVRQEEASPAVTQSDNR